MVSLLYGFVEAPCLAGHFRGKSFEIEEGINLKNR